MPYKCSDCSQIFSSNRPLYNLEQHRHTCGGVSELIRYVCSRCNRKFKLGASFNDHKCNIQEKKPQCPKKHKKKCEDTSPKPSQLQKHTEKCELISCRPWNKLKHKVDKQREQILVYGCAVCRRTFSRPDQLEKHQKVHQTRTSKRGRKCSFIKCPLCPVHYETQQGLEAHMKRHQVVARNILVHVCPRCDKSFSKLNHFVGHLKMHIGQRVHMCYICDLIFSTKGYLNRHKRGHHGLAYLCNSCGKLFYNKETLRWHRRFEVKSCQWHVCSLCQKRFAASAALKLHWSLCLKNFFQNTRTQGKQSCSASQGTSNENAVETVTNRSMNRSQANYSAAHQVTRSGDAMFVVKVSCDDGQPVVETVGKGQLVTEVAKITNSHGRTSSEKLCKFQMDAQEAHLMVQKLQMDAQEVHLTGDGDVDLETFYVGDSGSEKLQSTQSSMSWFNKNTSLEDEIASSYGWNSYKCLTCRTVFSVVNRSENISGFENGNFGPDGFLHPEIFDKNHNFDNDLLKEFGAEKQKVGQLACLSNGKLNLQSERLPCPTCKKLSLQALDPTASFEKSSADQDFSCSPSSNLVCDMDDLREEERMTGRCFMCDICSKVYLSQKDLLSHMAIHFLLEMDKTFTCPECHEEFTNERDLSIHTNSHTAKTYFECPLCLAFFVSKQQLDAHMELHDEDKPYSCSVCQRSFRSHSTLTRHLKTHNGNFGT